MSESESIVIVIRCLCRNNATLQLVALKGADQRGRYALLSKDLFHLILNEKPVPGTDAEDFLAGRRSTGSTFLFAPSSSRANQTPRFPFTINQSEYRTTTISVGSWTSSVCTASQREAARGRKLGLRVPGHRVSPIRIFHFIPQTRR